MLVSKKDFISLCNSVSELASRHNTSRDLIDTLYCKVGVLEKQLKCKHENFDVLECHNSWIVKLSGWVCSTEDTVETLYKKTCKACGFETYYDTEEEALADKQILLDRQIDALKEQKKSLNKK